MNNEGKILELLSELCKGQAEMRSDMAELKTDVAELQADMAELQTTVHKIDERSKRTQILLETDYEKKLQALFDGHMEIMQKMDDLAPMSRVEAVEGDVTTLEHVTKMLRQDIRELQKAQ